MKKRSLLTAFWLTCLTLFPLAGILPGRAQAAGGTGGTGAPSAPAPPSPGAIQGGSSAVSETRGGEYRLQPGDVLHVQVLNPDWQYLSGDVLVQPDGRVKLATKPTATIVAAGMTQAQFERFAEQAFGRMFLNPAIIVTAKTVTQNYIFMQGSFAKDGPYAIAGPLRALDALALAGGAPGGDLAQVVWTHGKVTRILNLERALRTGDPGQNVTLGPNDTLYVPEMRKHITVEGQVTNPKNLEFKEGTGIQEAVANAGGGTVFGDLTKVRVTHADNHSFIVNLRRIMDGLDPNIMLRADDVVDVPEASHFVVQGQVTTPKNIQLKPDMTLEEALAEAGGPRDRADISNLEIMHKNGTHLIVDLMKSGKDTTLIQPDDVITVPEQLDVTVQGQVITPRNILFRPGMKLTEAITAAGGSTDKADTTKVLIVSHDGKRREADWYTITSTGAADPYMLQPGDTVTVPEQLERILVSGEVNHALAIPYRQNLTLDTAITLAGGTTAQADLSHVKRQRVDDKGALQVEDVDLLTAQQQGKATQIILQPGDNVTVPRLTAQVFVLGAVNKPGAVQFRPGMPLLEALSGSSATSGGAGTLPQGAGGPTDKADLYSAVLTRSNGKTVDIDLNNLLNKGDTSMNIVLEPNDSLYVPESKHWVYVFGAVTKPGGYVLRDKEKVTVLDALQAAGGPLQTADLSKARVAHTAEGGKVDSTPLNLEKAIHGGQMAFNATTKPYDLLYIPAKGQRDPLATGIISALVYPLMVMLHL